MMFVPSPECPPLINVIYKSLASGHFADANIDTSVTPFRTHDGCVWRTIIE